MNKHYIQMQQGGIEPPRKFPQNYNLPQCHSATVAKNLKLNTYGSNSKSSHHHKTTIIQKIASSHVDTCGMLVYVK